MLKQEKPQKWIFDELSATNDMNFKFRDKEQPRSYVVYIAKNLMVNCLHQNLNNILKTKYFYSILILKKHFMGLL